MQPGTQQQSSYWLRVMCHSVLANMQFVMHKYIFFKVPLGANLQSCSPEFLSLALYINACKCLYEAQAVLFVFFFQYEVFPL